MCFSALLREKGEQTLCLTTDPIKSRSSNRAAASSVLQCPRREQTRLRREQMVGAAPAYVVGMNETWALTTRQPSGMRTHVWL
jgi:hypothetical protein